MLETNVNVPKPGITMNGTAWCQDSKRAKQFFGEHRVAYTCIDVDEVADGLRIGERHNGGKHMLLLRACGGNFRQQLSEFDKSTIEVLLTGAN
jgi:Glutaredoxin